MAKQMTGAEMVVEALKDQGVEMVFGYPGGAVLPIYDAIFHQNKLRHILVRHEQGAAHAAEGYARSTGKVGVVLVTSGPGATNAVTGPDRRAHGFDPDGLHHRPGADPSDRLRRFPGMRHDRHHAQLHQAQLSRAPHRGPAAHPARGVLYRLARPAGSGRRRHPEGRPVRDRRLYVPEERPAQDLSAAAQGRPRARSAGGRDDGDGEEAGLLHWRRRHQFRPPRFDAAARARARDWLSDHLHPDGPGRLSGVRQAMARHARHARLVRSQPRHARLRSHDLRRRALRRSHHRPHRRLLAEIEEDPHRYRSVVDQQERQSRSRHRRRLRARA